MDGVKVLLIDDDHDLLQLVSRIFEKSGAQVITAVDGLEGISKLFTYHPSLIVLDIMMPGQNGVNVCRRIRQVTSTPLIMLTAMNSEQSILEGLNAGADDYITKPFNPNILLARAAAILRRNHPYDNGHNSSIDYDDGHLKVDTTKHRVHVKNQKVKLTPVEFRLLKYLVNNAGRALHYEEILHNVWGSEYKGNDDYVHVYISQLRKKIEQNSKTPRYILSIHGVGYIFEKQSSR